MPTRAGSTWLPAGADVVASSNVASIAASRICMTILLRRRVFRRAPPLQSVGERGPAYRHVHVVRATGCPAVVGQRHALDDVVLPADRVGTARLVAAPGTEQYRCHAARATLAPTCWSSAKVSTPAISPVYHCQVPTIRRHTPTDDFGTAGPTAASCCVTTGPSTTADSGAAPGPGPAAAASCATCPLRSTGAGSKLRLNDS